MKIFRFPSQSLRMTHIRSKDEPVSSESLTSKDTCEILQNLAHFDDQLRVRFWSDQLQNWYTSLWWRHLRPVRKEELSDEKSRFFKIAPKFFNSENTTRYNDSKNGPIDLKFGIPWFGQVPVDPSEKIRNRLKISGFGKSLTNFHHTGFRF